MLTRLYVHLHALSRDVFLQGPEAKETNRVRFWRGWGRQLYTGAGLFSHTEKGSSCSLFRWGSFFRALFRSSIYRVLEFGAGGTKESLRGKYKLPNRPYRDSGLGSMAEGTNKNL